MNAFLWVLAVLLATGFLLAGIGKLTQPKEKLAAQPRMAWTEDFSTGNISRRPWPSTASCSCSPSSSPGGRFGPYHF
jgi:hypothetical protein